MSELIPLLDSAMDAFTARVEAVREDQWTARTPCRDWNVTELVMHVVDEHRWAPPLLAGHDLQTSADIVAGTSDRGDPARNWEAAVTESRRAFGEPGALDRTVELSRGATPVPDYVREMISDLVIHSWDLGKAIGYGQPLPEPLVEFGYDLAVEAGDLSASGLFDKPVQVPDDASKEDKLVALTGRDPR
jgi:uncharacterized protein (TIGR03086 family)